MTYRKRKLRGGTERRRRQYDAGTPTPKWKKGGPQKATRRDMQDSTHPDAKVGSPIYVPKHAQPDLVQIELDKSATQQKNRELQKAARAKLIAKKRMAVVAGRAVNCPQCGAGHRARKGKPGDDRFERIVPCCPSFVREMQRAFDPDDYEDYFAPYVQPPELSQTRIWYEGSAIKEAPWFKALNPILPA